jgi:hypothetical protein
VEAWLELLLAGVTAVMPAATDALSRDHLKVARGVEPAGGTGSGYCAGAVLLATPVQP